MAEPQVLWTVVPKSIGSGELAVTVSVAPRFPQGFQPGSPVQAPFDTWPDFLAAHLGEFALQVVDDNGAGPRLPAVLKNQLDPAMWRQFFANCRIDAWQDPPASPQPMTSNGARAVHGHLADQSATFFGATAQRLEEIRDSHLLEAPAVPFANAKASLGRLHWRRLPPGKEAPSPPPSKLAPSSPCTLRQRLAAVEGSRMRAIAERNFHRFARRPEEELTPTAIDGIASLSGMPAPDVHPETQAFLRTALFHSRVQRLHAETANRVDVASLVRTSDYGFNERIAFLFHHPAFLRPLGLALDLVAQVDPQTLPAHGKIQLVASFAGLDSRSAWTVFTRTNGTFRAADAAGMRPPCFPVPGANPGIAPALLSEGRLRVGDPDNQFQLAALDVDGAALGMAHAAHATLCGAAASQPLPPAPFNPPAQRSAGISLLHGRRPEALAARLATVASNYQQARDVTLYADDLVRGYRVDLRTRRPRSGPAGWRWYSLCAREEEYAYGPACAPDDELSHVRPSSQGEDPGHGSLQLAAATAIDKVDAQQAPTGDLHVPEAYFRWHGWSLTVPMPGECIPQDEDADRSSTAPVKRPPPWTIRPTFRIAEQAKLPPLRFGMRYRFALRGVDLNGDPMASPSSDSLDSCYLIPSASNPGLETVQDPDEAAAEPSGANDGATFRYLRYDPVAPPVVLLTRSLDSNRKKEGDTLRNLVLRGRWECVERCLIPAPGSMKLAELHGRFDAIAPADAGGMDIELVEMWGDSAQRRHWELPADDLSQNPIYRAPSHYPSDEERHLADRHYLPDPMVAALCVVVEDLVTGERRELEPHSFYGAASAWPKARPLFVRLEARDADDVGGTYTWTEEEPATLIVRLPPAWRVRLRLSSGLRREEARLMAHLNLWERREISGGHMTPPRQDGAVAAVACGCHPMITPGDELLLQYAVPRPLAMPDLAALETERQPLDAGVDLMAAIRVDRKSTGRVELLADWNELADDSKTPRPVSRPLHAQVKEIAVPAPDEAKDFDPQGLARIESKPSELRQVFSDTSYREVRYSLTAHSRFALNLPDRHLHAVSSQPVTVKVLGSAPPQAPAIAYVVPTFRWVQSDQALSLDPGHRYSSERQGGGLRVYVQRPWPGALAGELLGVVVWPAITQEQSAVLAAGHAAWIETKGEADLQDNPLSACVTRWGADPLWKGAAGPFRLPNANDFSGAVAWSDCLTLLEPVAPDQGLVSVVGYPAAFDEETQLWYADVALRPVPSYFTFIRLALVRYQPNSIKGAEISHVVRADFAQLVPDRSVTVNRVPGHRDTFSIHVFGQSRDAANGPANRFDLCLERPCSIAVSGGDMGWIRDTAAQATLTPGPSAALWSGQITAPCGCGPVRLVVREYEPFLADGPGFNLTNDASAAPTERLIYADVLGL
jgi:hypothetical protein